LYCGAPLLALGCPFWSSLLPGWSRSAVPGYPPSISPDRASARCCLASARVRPAGLAAAALFLVAAALLVPFAGSLSCSWHRRGRVERFTRLAAGGGRQRCARPLRFGASEIAAGVLLPDKPREMLTRAPKKGLPWKSATYPAGPKPWFFSRTRRRGSSPHRAGSKRRVSGGASWRYVGFPTGKCEIFLEEVQPNQLGRSFPAASGGGFRTDGPACAPRKVLACA
jgi:hypothetical protein